MINLLIPKDYELEEPAPGDKEGTLVFTKVTEGALVLLKVFPMEKEELMPYDKLQEIIDDIHANLDNNQGLIDVNAHLGTQKKGYIVYTIVKTVEDFIGATYALRLQVVPIAQQGLQESQETWVPCEMWGFFKEYGLTGGREAAILSLLEQNKKLLPDKSNWSCDPFVAQYKRGICMNLSEQEVYDDAFPDHPLSQCRYFIRHVLTNL